MQLDFGEATLALQQAVSQAANLYSAYSSGLLRFEVRMSGVSCYYLSKDHLAW